MVWFEVFPGSWWEWSSYCLKGNSDNGDFWTRIEFWMHVVVSVKFYLFTNSTFYFNSSVRLLNPGCCSILFRRNSGSPMYRAISLTFTLILFSLMKARLLILGWGHRHSWAIDIDEMDPPEFLDSIELGRGGLPVTLKGMEYLKCHPTSLWYLTAPRKGWFWSGLQPWGTVFTIL